MRFLGAPWVVYVDTKTVDSTAKVINMVEVITPDLKVIVVLLIVIVVLMSEYQQPRDYSDSNIKSSVIDHKPITMAQTKIEFIKTASSIFFEYDGKAENLQSFKYTLNLI